MNLRVMTQENSKGTRDASAVARPTIRAIRVPVVVVAARVQIVRAVCGDTADGEGAGDGSGGGFWEGLFFLSDRALGRCRGWDFTRVAVVSGVVTGVVMLLLLLLVITTIYSTTVEALSQIF